MIVVDEKDSTKLHPPVKIPKVKPIKLKAEKRVERRKSRSNGLVGPFVRSLAMGLLEGPLFILAFCALAVGVTLFMGSVQGKSNAEFADTAAASIAAEASASTIDDSTGGLPSTTEISGDYEEDGQVTLRDPQSGEEINTVPMIGSSDYRYTVSGTLGHYSIGFKKTGLEASGKSYRYDSKTGKITEVSEKELW